MSGTEKAETIENLRENILCVCVCVWVRACVQYTQKKTKNQKRDAKFVFCFFFCFFFVSFFFFFIVLDQKNKIKIWFFCTPVIDWRCSSEASTLNRNPKDANPAAWIGKKKKCPFLKQQTIIKFLLSICFLFFVFLFRLIFKNRFFFFFFARLINSTRLMQQSRPFRKSVYSFVFEKNTYHNSYISLYTAYVHYMYKIIYPKKKMIAPKFFFFFFF